MAITFLRRGGFVAFPGQPTNTVTINTSGASDASGQTGDLVIAHVCQQGGAVTSLSGSSSWTFGRSDFVGAWAWAIVPSSPATIQSPTFTWTGSFNGDTCWYQYRGVYSPSPIGAVSGNSTTGSTLVATQIITQRNNSRVLCLVTVGNNQTVTPPAAYTADSAIQQSNFGSIAAWGEAIASPGLSDPISKTITSTAWSAHMLELTSESAATTPFLVPSQTINMRYNTQIIGY